MQTNMNKEKNNKSQNGTQNLDKNHMNHTSPTNISSNVSGSFMGQPLITVHKDIVSNSRNDLKPTSTDRRTIQKAARNYIGFKSVNDMRKAVVPTRSNFLSDSGSFAKISPYLEKPSKELDKISNSFANESQKNLNNEL